jgi:hypothetical protein
MSREEVNFTLPQWLGNVTRYVFGVYRRSEARKFLSRRWRFAYPAMAAHISLTSAIRSTTFDLLLESLIVLFWMQRIWKYA